MENQTSTPALSTRRKIYYGITATTVAAQLTLPATVWLARMQLLPFTSPAQTAIVAEARGDRMAGERLMVTQARRAPGDFDAQFAAATMGSGEAQTRTQLDTLNTRYPHNPVVLAAMLRNEMQTPVCKRAEEGVPSNRTIPPASVETLDEARFERFDAIAADGERCDPTNAFFPAFRALAA